MSVVLSDSVIKVVEQAAKKRHLSVAQFVEKVLVAQSSAVLSDPYLEARAKKATGQGWSLLDSAPDAPPVPGDELPA